MTRTVTITTGARLHFGPLSYRPSTGRHFGGVGVMVAQPRFRLELTAATRDEVIADPPLSARILQLVARVREHSPAGRRPPCCAVRVVESIPAHSGLGSGTQLGMSIARGLAELAGERDVPAATLARRAGRGRRSAVGVHGYQTGGFIVDAGKYNGDDLGALACRLPFPPDWRGLLVTPQRSGSGLSGRPEENAFARLGSMPLELTRRLSHLIVTELLPAVGSADFAAFCHAVTEYGRRVGEFFAPLQGGVVGAPWSDALVEQWQRIGIRGLGQTSWGPTLFAFAASPDEGRDLAERLRSGLRDFDHEFEIRLVAPLNTGAEVTVWHDVRQAPT
jgi:beta-RFAP synthase